MSEALMLVLVGSAAGTLTSMPPPSLAKEDFSSSDSSAVTLFKTRTGLQYIELKDGGGPSPQYGQFCVIRYTGYVKLPNAEEKQKFDSADFLVKRGNGKIIAGLDEGLHTLKEGGVRRLIIPPKLGFVEGDLGPIPSNPFNRRKLIKLLDNMVEVRGGNLVYDVELLRVMDDEADQGYYQDESLTAEEFQKVVEALERVKTNRLNALDAEGSVGEA